MAAEWVDTHAHLADRKLTGKDGGVQVFRRAQAAGVVQIVAIGTTVIDNLNVFGLACMRDGVFASVGIHPNDAAETFPGEWKRIVGMADHPKVVALGETGLDRFRDRTPFALQQEWFDRHLDSAQELGLPVVIHCRDSAPDIIEQLSKRGAPVQGVLHSFTGTWDDASAFLELGLHLSFAGQITFQNKTLDALRAVAARVPVDRLLVETDSPYLSPHPFRGQTNEPARIATTGECLAGIRGIDLESLARLTTENARRLFNLPADDTL